MKAHWKVSGRAERSTNMLTRSTGDYIRWGGNPATYFKVPAGYRSFEYVLRLPAQDVGYQHVHAGRRIRRNLTEQDSQ